MGGWLRNDTDTRQMGIVDNYAVAMITDGVGPVVYQTDGDLAHENQMNKLAGILKQHPNKADLDKQRPCSSPESKSMPHGLKLGHGLG